VATWNRIGTTYAVQVQFPTDIAAGTYEICMALQAGANLAVSDLQPAYGQWELVYWDGTNIVSLAELVLTATERNAIADAYLDRSNGVETGVTPRQHMQRVGAAAGGKIRGATTGTETCTGMDGTTDRIQATVDASGNRSAITYDP
jgi:hypothetical protein